MKSKAPPPQQQQPPVVIADSKHPPTGMPAGSLWWTSDTGILYIYYNDGTSAQWVQAAANFVAE